MEELSASSVAGAEERSRSFAARAVEFRLGRQGGLLRARGGRMLRMSHQQRQAVTMGLAELKSIFEDSALMEQALLDAQEAERESGIAGLAADISFWIACMAAMSRGAWWLLLPGCGVPGMQAAMCERLVRGFPEESNRAFALAAQTEKDPYGALAKLLRASENARQLLAAHVRG